MSSSGSSSTNPFAAPAPEPPSAASAIVKINIHAHVPVVLDMDESNFRQWRTFFDLTFKKFGLTDHIDDTLDAILMQDEVEWMQIDSCIASWLYTTVSKDIMDAVYRPQQSAFSVWSGILGLFLDNSLHRAVFAQQEFHSLYQGDMTINEYTGKMKRLADTLYDVGAAVTDPALVINVLRGLNPDFSSAITYLGGKDPPPTYLYTHSYLLQEESRKPHTHKMEAATTLLAAGSNSSTSTTTPPPGHAAGNAGGNTDGDRRKKGKKSDGRSRSSNNTAPRPLPCHALAGQYVALDSAFSTLALAPRHPRP